MKITRRHLREIISEMVDENEQSDPWTFADTAQEEAEKINAQTGAGEFGMTLVTDQDYWEKAGIVTGEDLARSVLASTYSDTYKSLYGIRPRWMRFSEMTPKQIQAELDDLYNRSDPQADWDRDDEEWERRQAEEQEEDKRMRREEEELRAMREPELGEDLPSFQGMGRRPRSDSDRGNHPPGRGQWMTEMEVGDDARSAEGGDDLPMTLESLMLSDSKVRRIIKEELRLALEQKSGSGGDMYGGPSGIAVPYGDDLEEDEYPIDEISDSEQDDKISDLQLKLQSDTAAANKGGGNLARARMRGDQAALAQTQYA